MRFNQLLVSATIALLVGLAHSFLLVGCWAYLANHSPLLSLLLGLGLRGAALRGVLFPIDFLTSVLLCIPAAWVLAQLRPKAAWLYLALAIFPSFVWFNRLVFVAITTLPLGELALSWLLSLLPLPAAFWAIQRVASGSNKSFKPNPLRESA